MHNSPFLLVLDADFYYKPSVSTDSTTGLMLMVLDPAYALSAVDGRYAAQLAELAVILSESALINYRIRVEAAWLLHMAAPKVDLLKLGKAEEKRLHQLVQGQLPPDAIAQIKDLEKTTNHDVKAVEYWLRADLTKCGAEQKVLSHIHFACTSEDINNLAYGLMLKDLRSKIILPTLETLQSTILELAVHSSRTPMIARTHGQTASPTTMGKELAVFSHRLRRQINAIKAQTILGKFNGAVGNFNAHVAACPQLKWTSISRDFVEHGLGLNWNPLTTQIESHDSFVEYMQILRLCNTVLIDFVRDIWGYISLGYLSQKTVGTEVGSSTMPHKVNPIFFENAEGNLGVANSLLNHFAEKLPISRWQRDLSDSTVLRATGTAIGHCLLSYKSILRGLDRIAMNEQKMREDLANSWEVMAEPVQTVMRRYGVVDAYERLKAATRGSPVVTKEMIHAAIDSCIEIPVEEKARMKRWTPDGYIGIAPDLVAEFGGP